jgi:hypothetical protein
VLVVIAYRGIYSDYQNSKNSSQKSTALPSIPIIEPTITGNPLRPTLEPKLFIADNIQIKVRSPYSPDKVEAFIYKFFFDKSPNDIVKILPVSNSLPASWQSEGYSGGVQITRGGAELNIDPTFEGVSVPYYDQKPEIFEIPATKISSNVIVRIKDKNTENSYKYVSYYSEDCKQWQPLPLACHASDVVPDLVRENIVGTGLSIQCKANSVDVFNCDNLVTSLNITVIRL